jgi:CelD/BcsL family acetyltransferase involved in cellulose biosynthesis
MSIEVIDDITRLREFLPEWGDFARNNCPATPFQTPEWLITWWSHFGSGQLHVLVFRCEKNVTGVLPCFLHEWNHRRQLTLIGSGVSDYLDPIIDITHAPGILDNLRLHLGRCELWDVCDWQDLSAETPLQTLGATVEDMPCSRIELGESFEEFLRTRPKELKRNLRRYKDGTPLSARLRLTVSCRPAQGLLDSLIELHGARWRKCGETGTIEANHAEGFLSDIVAALSQVDMLLTFGLYFDGRIVAVILAFRNQTTIFEYLSAFDPEYEKFSFGRELLSRAIQYAHAHRYRCWDFLRGDEAYKSLWGAQLIPKRRLVLTSRAKLKTPA